ncbi:MAG: glycosyltransferase [Geobacteraceae bacterium]
MKIVIFACADFPEGPATTSRIRLLSRVLAAAGHEVSLAIFNANARQPIPENSLTSGEFESVHYRYLSGRTFRPAGFTGKLSDTLKGVVNSLLFLREKQKRGLVDAFLYYTPGIYRCLPTFLLARRYRIPILLELCEIFSCDTRKSGLNSNFKRLGARFSDRFLPVMSSGVLAISTSIIDFLKNQGVDNSRILHLPILVDHERFARTSTSAIPVLVGKRYFLNSGALDEKEGLEYILEAFAAVSKSDGQVCLAITGAPEQHRKKLFLELAKSLNIEERLLFTGFLSSDQLTWAYQNAIALLCCRASTPFANFGFPTKLAEYLSSGRPVITNEVGDMLRYLKDGENAFFARPEDSVSIAGQMTRILDSPDLASHVGINGRKTAADCFDYKNFVRPVDEFLRCICRKTDGNLSSRKAAECEGE